MISIKKYVPTYELPYSNYWLLDSAEAITLCYRYIHNSCIKQKQGRFAIAIWTAAEKEQLFARR